MGKIFQIFPGEISLTDRCGGFPASAAQLYPGGVLTGERVVSWENKPQISRFGWLRRGFFPARGWNVSEDGTVATSAVQRLGYGHSRMSLTDKSENNLKFMKFNDKPGILHIKKLKYSI
ncbi:MAG: hypothetical protein V8S89_06850 [Oscillospiraceae bacterium]